MMVANLAKIACLLVSVQIVCSENTEIVDFTAEDITAILQTVPEESRHFI